MPSSGWVRREHTRTQRLLAGRRIKRTRVVSSFSSLGRRRAALQLSHNQSSAAGLRWTLAVASPPTGPGTAHHAHRVIVVSSQLCRSLPLRPERLPGDCPAQLQVLLRRQLRSLKTGWRRCRGGGVALASCLEPRLSGAPQPNWS